MNTDTRVLPLGGILATVVAGSAAFLLGIAMMYLVHRRVLHRGTPKPLGSESAMGMPITKDTVHVINPLDVSDTELNRERRLSLLMNKV